MQGSSQSVVVVADHISHSSSSQCHQHHHDYVLCFMPVCQGGRTHDVMLVEKFLFEMLEGGWWCSSLITMLVGE